MPEVAAAHHHYPALDGLRGLAALLIVWHHFLQLTPIHGFWLAHLAPWFAFSWVGVDLFFVLSGFLITGILADAKFKQHYFRSFYARRVLRIFPLYYAVLFMVLVILPSLGIKTGISPQSHIYFWTYTSNFYFANTGWYAHYLSHLWTLAIEEQFYIFWPIVIFLVPLNRLQKVLPLMFLSVTVLRAILYSMGFNFVWLHLVTFTHCDGLVLGSYLALAIRSTDSRALQGLRPNKLTALFFVFLASFILNEGGFFYHALMVPIVLIASNLIILPILAILFVWLIYEATTRTCGIVFRIFSQRVLRWFGKYSYALYILHVPIAFLILQGNLRWLSPHRQLAQLELVAAYFGTCILAAFLSWHLFEKHFLKLKRYFRAENADVTAVFSPQES